MKVTDFDYDLPESFIAQTPATPRDSSRLLRLDRTSSSIQHFIFRDIIDLLNPGDVLVLNSTRVIPARLKATKSSGGAVEILLLHHLEDNVWRGLVGGKRVREGTVLTFSNSSLTGEVVESLDGAERLIRFSESLTPTLLDSLGEMPLPPYIQTRLHDGERYQTVYGKQAGSAAAPTAGLHFTGELLIALKAKGIELAYCTLHIGLDTFQPVRVDTVEEHTIHSEWASLSAEDANRINRAKLAGGRIIAVGTTSARTLETAAILSAGGDPAQPDANSDVCAWRPVIAFERSTNLFIYPGYSWRAVDAIITNFHLPKSTLLMMMSAFAGRETILNAYEIAKKEGYRFFSFGDAMFIT